MREIEYDGTVDLLLELKKIIKVYRLGSFSLRV